MKLRGGYDVQLSGRPSDEVEALPEPKVLHLPLASGRFSFAEVSVEEGQRVRPGQVLARDTARHGVPLLAPRAGTASLGAVDGHVTLEDVAREPEEKYSPDDDAAKAPPSSGLTGDAAAARLKLLELGAWQFVRDAHTGELPDPFGSPRAVVVSTLNLEPFVARGEVLIAGHLPEFTRGLEALKSLLEAGGGGDPPAGGERPVYLVVARGKGEGASSTPDVRERLRGLAGVKTVEIAPRYPHDDLAVLARFLGFGRKDGEPVWGLGAAGVLAVDRSLELSLPCTARIVSLGGPAVEKPLHLEAVPGYPLKEVLDSRVGGDEVRVIDGGAMTGRAVGPEELGLGHGLGVECEGITVLPELVDREFLGFMRPGLDRRSFSRNFMSLLRGAFPERFTTGLRGERRPCVTCGFCEDVCPSGIMPHLIHKFLYKGDIDGAERARVDLCVECGLCTYVCPSKIELRQQFIEAKETIRQELHAGEVTA